MFEICYNFVASQQLNGTQTLPSVLSSLSSTTTGSTTAPSNFTYSDATAHRKTNNTISMTPSPDDRSNSLSQISDFYNTNSISIMQSNANQTANFNTSSSLNTSTSLANLSDYSVQMNQLNDLINDDNGDGLDMSFWENFDNFNYDLCGK